MNRFLSFLKRISPFRCVVIDGIVFRLHYRLTLIILVILSIVVAWRQQFGVAIQCATRDDDMPKGFVDNYCYRHSTFSIVEALSLKVGEEIPYPGITKYKPDNTKVYHTYYQWVPIVLFLQAILFYVPRLFWKAMESGTLEEVVEESQSPPKDDDAKRVNVERMADCVLSYSNRNGRYFVFYVVAEVLNIVNVIGQIYLMDAFLGGRFLSYGPRVVQFSGWDTETHNDPTVRVFPLLATCNFHRYGSSGDVQRHNAMCSLPINVLNQKIYLFLWFWFVLLAVLSCLAAVFKIWIYALPLRRWRVLGLCSRLAKKQHLMSISRQSNIGDWLVINLLSKNLSSGKFRDLVAILAERMDGKNCMELLED